MIARPRDQSFMHLHGFLRAGEDVRHCVPSYVAVCIWTLPIMLSEHSEWFVPSR